ncbi:MAG: hypothetical protein DSZ28_00210, partial [Thiothrix sp.]
PSSPDPESVMNPGFFMSVAFILISRQSFVIIAHLYYEDWCYTRWPLIQKNSSGGLALSIH